MGKYCKKFQRIYLKIYFKNQTDPQLFYGYVKIQLVLPFYISQGSEVKPPFLQEALREEDLFNHKGPWPNWLKQRNQFLQGNNSPINPESCL